MKATTFLQTLAVLLTCSQVFAIDYVDFPENLQRILDDRQAELEDKGEGFCIAGRVRFEDGRLINDRNDVKVNMIQPLAYIMDVHYGGWFIGRPFSSSAIYIDTQAGNWIGLRAFGYDPIDIEQDLVEGQINYFEFVMKPTPKDRLSAASGFVIDENGHAIPGAKVFCHFRALKPMGETWIMDHWEYMRHTFTEPNGFFRFDNLTADDFFLFEAQVGGYVNSTKAIHIKMETTEEKTMQMFPGRQVALRYAYQPDGSPSFLADQVQSGTVILKHNEYHGYGLTFSGGRLDNYAEDLRITQPSDKCFFEVGILARDHKVGFYDLGLIPFEQVTEVQEDDSLYNWQVPCLVGHVYAARTHRLPNYAKFQVLAEEYSFRTVWPDTVGEFVFKGYDLSLNVTRCSGQGKLYVRKVFAPPQGAQITYLPAYWELSCTEGIQITADVRLTYDPKEIQSLGLGEEDLSVYQFKDAQQAWVRLETRRDTEMNLLTSPEVSLDGFLMIGK